MSFKYWKISFWTYTIFKLNSFSNWKDKRSILLPFFILLVFIQSQTRQIQVVRVLSNSLSYGSLISLRITTKSNICFQTNIYYKTPSRGTLRSVRSKRGCNCLQVCQPQPKRGKIVAEIRNYRGWTSATGQRMKRGSILFSSMNTRSTSSIKKWGVWIKSLKPWPISLVLGLQINVDRITKKLKRSTLASITSSCPFASNTKKKKLSFPSSKLSMKNCLNSPTTCICSKNLRIVTTPTKSCFTTLS